MKRFRFSLQKLLDLRGQEVEQARRALAQALSHQAEADRQLGQARVAYGQGLERLAERELVGLRVAEFANARAHIARLGREVEKAEWRAEQASRLVHSARGELMGARQRQRALEKLRERRLEQYQLEALREEQKELDEYGSRRSINDSAGQTDIN